MHKQTQVQSSRQVINTANLLKLSNFAHEVCITLRAKCSLLSHVSNLAIYSALWSSYICYFQLTVHEVQVSKLQIVIGSQHQGLLYVNGKQVARAQSRFLYFGMVIKHVYFSVCQQLQNLDQEKCLQLIIFIKLAIYIHIVQS